MNPRYDLFLVDLSTVTFDPETPPVPLWLSIGWGLTASLIATLSFIFS